MLSLLPLPEIHYRQVYEWEPGECDFDAWLAHVQQPSYLNYGVFREDEFVGYLGLEKTAPDTVCYHASLARRKVTPSETRRLVIDTGIYLFHSGIECLETKPPTINIAACRLAERCHLSFDAYVITNHTLHSRYTLMKDSYLQNPQQWEAD